MIFVTGGELRLSIDGAAHDLGPGGYAYIPSGADWSAHASGERDAVFHWVRKHYAAVEGIDLTKFAPPLARPGTTQSAHF